MENFYNAHVHVFTFKNVPDRFGKTFAWGLAGLISIQKFRKSKFFRILLNLMRHIIKSDADVLDRIANFIEHGQGKDAPNCDITQKDVFKNLQSYYPKGTKFIALSMDMEYMDAGEVPEKFDKQTKELEQIKQENPEIFYPFIFVDPRRIETTECFNGEKNFSEYLKKKLEDCTFAGIKMYPALGYWPFDKRLKDIYDFALDKSIPIMVHCSGGPVYYRGKLELNTHPIDENIKLFEKEPKDFAKHFSNPINYHMLMSKNILKKNWESDARDYSKLKICLGHFGGEIEWMKYLQNPWVAATDISDDYKFISLKRENWNFENEFKSGKFTWFSVICDLLKKYDNLYADISSSLENEKIYPLLKILLESNSELKNKILFGTDYYMVSIDKSERELSIGLRSYLGEELFERIAVTNVKKFLFEN